MHEETWEFDGTLSIAYDDTYDFTFDHTRSAEGNVLTGLGLLGGEISHQATGIPPMPYKIAFDGKLP